MKKLVSLFIAFLAIGGIFQSCDNSKTYAEMLEDERDAVNDYIKKYGINVISESEFERDTITDVSLNQYVGFSNGVYLQIVERYGSQYASLEDAPAFENNNLILSRFVEVDIMQNDTTIASNVGNPYQYLNHIGRATCRERGTQPV